MKKYIKFYSKRLEYKINNWTDSDEDWRTLLYHEIELDNSESKSIFYSLNYDNNKTERILLSKLNEIIMKKYRFLKNKLNNLCLEDYGFF